MLTTYMVNVTDDGENIIGFAKLKTIVDELKRLKKSNVLLLSGGDMIHGTNLALSKGGGLW